MLKRIPVLLGASVISIACLAFVALIATKENTSNDNAQRNVAQESSTQEVKTVEQQVIIINTDTENKTIELKEITTGNVSKLAYTDGTSMKDKYGTEHIADQIEPGEIATVTYREDDQTLLTLKESNDTWEYTKVKNLTYNQTDKSVAIGETQYQYDNSLSLVSNGKTINFMDLNDMDVLTVRGKDKTIYSIEVTSGHGYAKLENDTQLIGGWIDVDLDVASPITKDMLLAVPEGDHNITVSNNGISGTKSVTIKRGETLSIDVGEFKAAPVKSGSVQFKITPKDAKLYINQKLTDYSKLITLDYGTYRIDVTASGCTTYSKKLVLGSTYAEITVDLDDSATTDASSTTASSTSNTLTDSSESSVGSIKSIEVPNLTSDPSLGTSTESSTSSTTDSVSLDSLLSALTGSSN